MICKCCSAPIPCDENGVIRKRKFCSKHCQRKAYKLTDRGIANREKSKKKHQEESLRALKANPVAEVICAECSKGFIPPRTHRSKMIYCNPKCQRRASSMKPERKESLRKYKREKILQNRPAWKNQPKACIHCGVMYMPSDYANEKWKCCSTKCSYAYSSKRYRSSERGKEAKRERDKKYREKRVPKPKRKKVVPTAEQIEQRRIRNNELNRIQYWKKHPGYSERYLARGKTKEERDVERRKKHREYYAKRIASDSVFRIVKITRGRIRSVLKGKKKYRSTLALLGVESAQQVRDHIASQFKEGMSWENHRWDTWHIDHIIPLASFDLTNEEEQLKAFNYKNLQPLWAKDNIRKGARIIPSDT